jgi:hypothetical protein
VVRRRAQDLRPTTKQEGPCGPSKRKEDKKKYMYIYIYKETTKKSKGKRKELKIKGNIIACGATCAPHA